MEFDLDSKEGYNLRVCGEGKLGSNLFLNINLSKVNKDFRFF